MFLAHTYHRTCFLTRTNCMHGQLAATIPSFEATRENNTKVAAFIKYYRKEACVPFVPKGYLLYGQRVLASLSLLADQALWLSPLQAEPAYEAATRGNVERFAADNQVFNVGRMCYMSLISISANEWCCMHKATACVDPSQHSHSALNYSVMSLMHGLQRQGGQLSMSRMC